MKVSFPSNYYPRKSLKKAENPAPVPQAPAINFRGAEPVAGPQVPPANFRGTQVEPEVSLNKKG